MVKYFEVFVILLLPLRYLLFNVNGKGHSERHPLLDVGSNVFFFFFFSADMIFRYFLTKKLGNFFNCFFFSSAKSTNLGKISPNFRHEKTLVGREWESFCG
jgi:hypothetical protein